MVYTQYSSTSESPFRLWRELRRDGLGLLKRVGHQADVARIGLGSREMVLVSHPDLIEQVLVVQHRKFIKGRGLQMTRRVLGQGLLTSEGAFWQHHRQMAQPAFHRRRVEAYSAIMVDDAVRQMSGWHDGERRDMAEEMMRLTLAIIAQVLFSTDVENQASQVGHDLTATMRETTRRMRSLVRVPEWVPTPRNQRTERAARRLDHMIFSQIRERETQGHPHDDLLALLMEARDSDGHAMSPRQLRDEMMTLFLAGHETTANTLSWTWYLLSQHPAAEAKLHQELAHILGSTPPRVDQLDALVYTRAVIQESMRLYPPAWVVGRQAIEPFELGGQTFPVGTQVLMSQWVMHRHPRYFHDPEAFLPERWIGENTTPVARFAYFPFGGGPRLCIGRSFALMEAPLLLATLAQHYQARMAPDSVVEPEALITLRPKNGLPMILSRWA